MKAAFQSHLIKVKSDLSKWYIILVFAFLVNFFIPFFPLRHVWERAVPELWAVNHFVIGHLFLWKKWFSILTWRLLKTRRHVVAIILIQERRCLSRKPSRVFRFGDIENFVSILFKMTIFLQGHFHPAHWFENLKS